MVEAPDRRALINAAKGLSIRLSRAINRIVGRSGRVWGDRYHISELISPRQVRHALVYVLMNFKKHLATRQGLDAKSSASRFDGWTERPPPVPDAPLLDPPRTWLLSTGWRRHGLISPTEALASIKG